MAQLKVMDPVAQLAAELGQFAPAAARPGLSNGSEWGFTGTVNLVGTGRSIMSGSC